MRIHRLFLSTLALGLFLSQGTTQAVTLTARAVAVDGIGITPTADILIDPGQTVTVDFFYSGWGSDIPGSTLLTYQVGVEGFDAYVSGSTGRLVPLGWNAQWPASCMGPGECASTIPLCDTSVGTCQCIGGVGTCPAAFPTCRAGLCAAASHDTSQGVFIDTDRADFAFAGIDYIDAVLLPGAALSPVWGATILVQEGPSDVGQLAYAGTHIVRASDDACGVFTFSFGTTPGTFIQVRDAGVTSPEMEPGVIDTVTITVGQASPCDPLPTMLLSPRRLDRSLARVRLNPVALDFDGPIDLPGAADLAVMELTPDVCAGTPGPSVSEQLEFVVDANVDPNRLVITDVDSSTYQTGRWYRIANTGAWAGVEPFEVDFRVLIGDANGNGFVNFADLTTINESVPTLPSGIDDSNRNSDVNADGFINFGDMTTTVHVLPSTSAPYPCQ